MSKAEGIATEVIAHAGLAAARMVMDSMGDTRGELVASIESILAEVDAAPPVDPPPVDPPIDDPPLPTGRYQTAGNQILNPDGEPFVVAGINAAVNLIPGPFVFGGFQGGDGECVGAYDTDLSRAKGCFSGGGITSAGWANKYGTTPQVWDPLHRGHIDLPSRIPQIRDNWKQGAVRVNLVSRGAPEPPTVDDILASAVPAIGEIIAGGLVAIVTFHDPDHHAKNLPSPPDGSTVVTAVKALAETFKDESAVWLNPVNEPFTTINRFAWGGQQSSWIELIRERAPEMIIVCDLAGYGQDLVGLADRKYQGWYETQGGNIVMSWHAYGARGIGEPYRYATMDADLANATDEYPLIIGEYGNANVAGNAGPHQWNVAAVDFLARGGTPLALKYGVSLFAWHATGDASYSHLYKLTEGREFGADDGLSIPMWRIEDQDDPRLSDFGSTHWHISHSLANR